MSFAALSGRQGAEASVASAKLPNRSRGAPEREFHRHPSDGAVKEGGPLCTQGAGITTELHWPTALWCRHEQMSLRCLAIRPRQGRALHLQSRLCVAIHNKSAPSSPWVMPGSYPLQRRWHQSASVLATVFSSDSAAALPVFTSCHRAMNTRHCHSDPQDTGEGVGWGLRHRRWPPTQGSTAATKLVHNRPDCARTTTLPASLLMVYD